MILYTLTKVNTLLNIFNCEMTDGRIEWLSQAKSKIEASILRCERYVFLWRPDQGKLVYTWGQSVD